MTENKTDKKFNDDEPLVFIAGGLKKGFFVRLEVYTGNETAFLKFQNTILTLAKELAADLMLQELPDAGAHNIVPEPAIPSGGEVKTEDRSAGRTPPPTKRTQKNKDSVAKASRGAAPRNDTVMSGHTMESAAKDVGTTVEKVRDFCKKHNFGEPPFSDAIMEEIACAFRESNNSKPPEKASKKSNVGYPSREKLEALSTTELIKRFNIHKEKSEITKKYRMLNMLRKILTERGEAIEEKPALRVVVKTQKN